MKRYPKLVVLPLLGPVLIDPMKTVLPGVFPSKTHGYVNSKYYSCKALVACPGGHVFIDPSNGLPRVFPNKTRQDIPNPTHTGVLLSF